MLHAEGFGSAAYRPIIAPAPAADRPEALVQAIEASHWRRAFKAGLSNPQRLTLYTALAAKRLKLWRPRA